MNRRKKEADQHKGWNISISGVFIAMVMGIVLISVGNFTPYLGCVLCG